MGDAPAPECLGAILDLLDVAVACMDLQGRVQVWNRTSEQLTGWTRDEMIGSTVDRVVPPDGREERKRVIAQTLAEGHARGAFRRLRRDGTIFRIEMRTNLIRGKRGEPLAIAAFVTPLAGHGDTLTPKQVEVLGHVVAGRTNAEIARRLVVSRRTVDRHVAAILDKLGAENRAAAAAIGVSAGLARVEC